MKRLNSVAPLNFLRKIINDIALNAKSDRDDEHQGTLLHCLFIQLTQCDPSITNEVEQFIIDTINNATSNYKFRLTNNQGDTLLHSVLTEECLSIAEVVLVATERCGQLQALAGTVNNQNELSLHILLQVLKRKCEVFKTVGDSLKPKLLEKIARIQNIALKLITANEISCFQKNNKGQTPRSLLAEIKLILGPENSDIRKLEDAMGYLSVAQGVSNRFLSYFFGSKTNSTLSTEVTTLSTKAPSSKQ